MAEWEIVPAMSECGLSARISVRKVSTADGYGRGSGAYGLLRVPSGHGR